MPTLTRRAFLGGSLGVAVAATTGVRKPRGVVAVDNGDGTITWYGPGVVDNGDGTFTLNGVTAFGSGAFTV